MIDNQFDNNKREEEAYDVFIVLGIPFIALGVILMTTVSHGFIAFIGIGLLQLGIGIGSRLRQKRSKNT